MPSSALQCPQMRQEIGDLRRFQLGLRHPRVTSADPLGERLCELLDGIPLVQVTKGRRRRERAAACRTNGMAP
jgi:hypothetical protein